MPGIFGIIDTSPRRSREPLRDVVELVRRMSAAMLYESFYSASLVSYPDMGACVGQVELDSSDGFGAGRHHGYTTVVTTGETRPDVLPVDLPGEEIVRRIDGKCSGFVADRRAQKCLLFNDRYGRERLFLHFDGSRVLFSSEAKAILAVAPRTRAFEEIGLAEFVACGCTLGSHSLFRDIEVLEPGSVLTFEKAGVHRRRVFREEGLEGLAPVPGTQFLEGFAEGLRSAVDRAVKRSPVGISLTGGLDSRMIMASMDAPSGTVPCYTFGSMYRTTADVAVARKVAARCGQPHRVIEVGRDFLSRVEEFLQHSVYVSDGYLGLSGAAELYVNRHAHLLAPTRMTGNWGGELMRGVHAFKFTFPKGRFIAPELDRCMRESADAFSAPISHPISKALFHQMPLQGYGRYAIERSQVLMRSPFLTDDVVQWLYRAPADVRASSAVAVLGRRADLLAIPTDIGLLGSGPSVVRRSWRRALVKAEYLTSHGAPDFVTRLSARLPASLLETRFLGVDKFHHFRFWMRHDLAGFVRDTLVRDNSLDLSAWFDMREVASMVRDHIAGDANYTDAIDKVLTAAIVQKTLFKADHVAKVRVPAAAEYICDAITL